MIQAHGQEKKALKAENTMNDRSRTYCLLGVEYIIRISWFLFQMCHIDFGVMIFQQPGLERPCVTNWKNTRWGYRNIPPLTISVTLEMYLCDVASSYFEKLKEEN